MFELVRKRVPPMGVALMWNLVSIELVDDNTYRVRIRGRGEERSFLFTVEKTAGFDVVVGEDAFLEFCGLQSGAGSSLSAAVLSFHRAQRVWLPDSA